MLNFDFESSVAYWVFKAAHAMACALNEELQVLGITSRQWEVLGWLSHEGEMSQTELAERMFIEAPTLVGVLDRMERDGWIVRVTDESDRRRKIIRTTERCEEQWSRMVACGLGIRARALQGLSEEDTTQIRAHLKQICENLGIVAGPRRESKAAAAAAALPTE
jgi:MarR family transcriptional regulator for hemolysin